STSASPFVVIQAPKITSFTPALGPVDTVVTVNGTGLDTVTKVTLGGVDAVPLPGQTATKLTFKVQPESVPGQVTVTNPAGPATSPASFKVTPKILSLDPDHQPIGQQFTVHGYNLLGSTTPTVKLNGKVAAVDLAHSDRDALLVTVPTGATTGAVAVT